MSLPIVRCSGSPREQGLAHGRDLREAIAHNIRLYFDRFENEARLPRRTVLDWAARYLEAIRRDSPDYAEGMEGVAEGAGADLLEVAALNVRYELLYYRFGRIAMDSGTPPAGHSTEGCTAFGLLPAAAEADHLIHGQNWDWIPGVAGAVLHTTSPDGMQSLAFTEAGIFGGKIGINSAGIGLTINGMTTTDDDWSRLSPPVHVRCRDILLSRSLEEAVAVVTGAPRACSTNFMISFARPGGGGSAVVDVEAAPETVRIIEPTDDRLVHTNHFLDPDALGVVEPPKKRLNTYSRLERMESLLAGGKVSVPRLREFLCDHDNHPYSLCRSRGHAGPSVRAIHHGYFRHNGARPRQALRDPTVLPARHLAIPCFSVAEHTLGCSCGHFHSDSDVLL